MIDREREGGTGLTPETSNKSKKAGLGKEIEITVFSLL